jgi:hypothetical protein
MFKQLKQAFARAVATCQSLECTIAAQTEAIKAQTEAVRAVHQTLALVPTISNSIAAVEQHTKFLAASERASLTRQGHRAEL